MRARAAAVIAALVVSPAPATAQVVEARLPNPRLVDSPWGDFPLSRLEPGARLRLTAADGQRAHARLVTLRDSAMELRAREIPQLRTLTLPELRALRALEVRAIPLGRKRTTTIAALSGVAIGAIVGAAGYGGRSSKFAEESWSGYVTARAAVGGLVGWAIGTYVLGRARWRPVTIP